MQALVTGAAGFIGSRLAERLLEAGWTVRAVDSLTPYYDVAIKRSNMRALDEQGAHIAEVDLRTADLDDLVEGIDAVFHFAAQPGVRTSWASFADYVEHNVLVTQRLLEAVRAGQVGRFVLASSSSVYGQAGGAVDEDAPTRPYSPYGVTKLAAESLARAYAENFALPITTLRLFTVYGPGQRPDMALHRLICASLCGNEFEVFGDGSQARAFTYVHDVVDAVFSVVETLTDPGAVFNIAGDCTHTVAEVVATVEEATGRTVRVVHRDAQAGDVARTEAVVDRARAVLGWTPTTDFADGVARQVAELRRHLVASNASS